MNDSTASTASTDPGPPMAGNEAVTLLAFLERQRATFAWKTGGLDAAGLRATAGPSSMTLGGLLKHLARFEDDMSTEWLHGRAQLPPWNAVDWENDPDWDWRTAGGESPEQLYGRWRDAVARSRALFAEALAEGGPARRGSVASDSTIELPNLRYIFLNMIEEYARHNGHADLLRESVDGLVGQDPPD
ncbi:DinB family protein [Arthrobacter frigidicola]|nr:DinB family protein [Arthrobacter frigidicola]